MKAHTLVKPTKPAKHTAEYEGQPVVLWGDDPKHPMMHSTQLWNAAGRPENKEPWQWQRLPSTQEILDGLTGELSPNKIILTTRGRGDRGGGTWYHWQFALEYARYLDRKFGQWCNHMVIGVIAHHGGPREPEQRAIATLFEEIAGYARQLPQMANRLNDIRTHLSREMVDEVRTRPSASARKIITHVISNPPFEGRCPCCGGTLVLTKAGKEASGAEYDAWFGRSKHEARHIWLICRECHRKIKDPWEREKVESNFRAVQEFVLAYIASVKPKRVVIERGSFDDDMATTFATGFPRSDNLQLYAS